MQWLGTSQTTDAQRVYVVDDDVSLSGSVRFLLATLKLGSRTFRSGRDFLDRVETLPPGVILLDLRMPDMDGFAVQEELKCRGIDWPIILMTGDAAPPAMARAAQRGGIDLILKPFSDEKLLAALHNGFLRLKEVTTGRTPAQAQGRASHQMQRWMGGPRL